MDHTARMTGAPDQPAAPRPGTTHATRRTTPKGRSADELHGTLDAAWRTVNEVARLVDELHRKRGRGRLR